MNYQNFRNSCLDLSPLGLYDGSDDYSDDAQVLAWLVDSPVCFCQFPQQSSIVFAANPNAMSGEQLLPVAADIPEFIGLLVCCKNAALIAGAHQWSSFRFQELVDSIQPGMKAASVLRALVNIYHPPVIHDPWAMMAKLRKELSDASVPENWYVDFETDLGKPGLAGSGKEMPLNRCEGGWHVPSAYLCSEGVVVDTYLEIPPERLKEFHEQWNNRSQESVSLADKLQRHLDDPLTAAVTGILSINDKPIRCKCSFSAIWNPWQDNDSTVRSILNHYRLDPDQGYLFRRFCFLRKNKYPKIRTMQLTLEAAPVMVPDKSFFVEDVGTRFRFTHPATGLEHTFTVVSEAGEALNPNFLTNHPCYYTRLNYTLEPSISPENFRIVDQNPGDPWEGYQDEPAAIIYADRKPDPGRYALSSLHYAPRERVQWRMVFRRKLHPDIQLRLLP